MTWINFERRLSDIRADLTAGRSREPVSVKEFLQWFGAARRGYWVNKNIDSALNKYGLLTQPNFDSVHIDAPITFALARPESRPELTEPAPPESGRLNGVALPPGAREASTTATVRNSIAATDPAFRIGRLAAANSRPISVVPDCSILEVTTLLLRHDYSQVPVMSSDRDVKGIVRWEDIGSSLVASKPVLKARDCMRAHCEVSFSDSLFKVIGQVIEHSCVLVRGPQKTITGLVTPSDISSQFQQLSEPFLLLAEIENHIRALLDGIFSKEELQGSTDAADSGRSVSSIADLSFGEYIRVLERPEYWARCGLPVDRVVFVRELDRVRRIRNDVMHFDPDGITGADHQLLKDFVHFVHRVHALSRR